MMFNGDMIKSATGTGKGGFLDKVASGPLTNAAKIETLYMAALARKPSGSNSPSPIAWWRPARAT